MGRVLMKLATTGDFTTPTCPSCGIKMVRRKSKEDGEESWGGLNYPGFRSTIQIGKN
jgi:restriction system protein